MYLLKVCAVILSVIMTATADELSTKFVSIQELRQLRNNFVCSEPTPRTVYIRIENGAYPRVPVILHKCDKCSGYCKGSKTCRPVLSEPVVFQVLDNCWIAERNHTRCECEDKDHDVQINSLCEYEIKRPCIVIDENNIPVSSHMPT